MGYRDKPKQTTYYFSYTNLVSTGTLVLEGKKFQVTGKSWFDKQGGGTYKINDRNCNWEWVSMRFFDDEEVMLFAFPHRDYYYGTYIGKTGEYKRLNEYKMTSLAFTEAGNYKFSFGWQVNMKGIKDEENTLRPKIQGQFNFYFFELLAEILDKNNTLVGYAVIELLPGVYNKKLYNFRLFKRL